jgi:hypothetical protein
MPSSKLKMFYAESLPNEVALERQQSKMRKYLFVLEMTYSNLNKLKSLSGNPSQPSNNRSSPPKSATFVRPEENEDLLVVCY